MGLLSFLFWHCCPFGQVPFVILSQRTWHLPLIQIWPVAQCSCSKQISCEFSGLIFKQLWPIFEHLFLLLQESRHLPFMQIWLMLQSLLSRQLGTQSPLLVKDSSLIFDRWHFYVHNQRITFHNIHHIHNQKFSDKVLNIVHLGDMWCILDIHYQLEMWSTYRKVASTNMRY